MLGQCGTCQECGRTAATLDGFCFVCRPDDSQPAPALAPALWQADNLKVLPSLPSGSVDVILTDPPYGQTNETYDRPPKPRVWEECYRLGKEGSALLAFSGNPTYHRLASSIEAAGWQVVQMWGWVHKDGVITSAYPREGFDRLAPALTPIVYARKGKVLLDLKREGDAWEMPSSKRTWSERARIPSRARADGHWPRNLVCTDGIEGFQFFSLPFRSTGTERVRGERHPNEKPLPLVLWLLQKFKGQVVLDPYMGGGTTGVACTLLGKTFVGIEVSAGYFGLATQRITRAQEEDPR
jgi:site-specific DNA-methyltransferase (adenine-specific)